MCYINVINIQSSNINMYISDFMLVFKSDLKSDYSNKIFALSQNSVLQWVAPWYLT